MEKTSIRIPITGRIVLFIVIKYLIYNSKIRAVVLGITYDEAWTINDFVHQRVINILNYTPCDANNHILNTLAIKLVYFLTGASTFTTRLPNVLAFIVYLYF